MKKLLDFYGCDGRISKIKGHIRRTKHFERLGCNQVGVRERFRNEANSSKWCTITGHATSCCLIYGLCSVLVARIVNFFVGHLCFVARSVAPSNFVVFPGNENMLKILERNGRALEGK